MILETERLILREFSREDEKEFSKVLLDPEAMKYFPYEFTPEHVMSWICFSINGYKEQGFSFWAVIRKSDGAFLGDCGITLQNIDGEQLPEVGYHFKREFWGLGYATEAAKACVQYGLNKLKFPAMYSYMTKENTPSQKVAQRVGMKKVKEFSGKGMDLVVYKIGK